MRRESWVHRDARGFSRWEEERGVVVGGGAAAERLLGGCKGLGVS